MNLILKLTLYSVDGIDFEEDFQPDFDRQMRSKMRKEEFWKFWDYNEEQGIAFEITMNDPFYSNDFSSYSNQIFLSDFSPANLHMNFLDPYSHNHK